MRYFAKYLEANKFHWFPKSLQKINVGDMALKPAFRYHDGDRDRLEPEYHEEVYEDEDTSAFALVRMFLCTRDLQVGDTNIFSYMKKDGCLISYNENLNFIKMYPNGRANLGNDLCSSSSPYPFKRHIDLLHGFEGDTFKVVGVISKQADWVCEYDEFNEDEVEYSPLKGGTFLNYKIKCPHCKNLN